MQMYTHKYISNKYVPQVILFEHDVMPSQASRNLRLKHTVGVQKRRIGVREVNKCPGSENMVTDGSFFGFFAKGKSDE